MNFEIVFKNSVKFSKIQYRTVRVYIGYLFFVSADFQILHSGVLPTWQ